MATDFRTWAQGHPAGCQIRLPGCVWGPTIGSHIPSGVRFGKGVGYKPADWPGLALSCDYCHGVVDGRTRTIETRDGRLLAWYEGMYATTQVGLKDPEYLRLVLKLIGGML